MARARDVRLAARAVSVRGMSSPSQLPHVTISGGPAAEDGDQVRGGFGVHASHSDAKVTNRDFEVWRDRGWPLNDGRIPNPNIARVRVSTGYHRVEGNRRASRNGPVSDLPPETPIATFSSLFFAGRGIPVIIPGLISTRSHASRVCSCPKAPPIGGGPS